MENSPYKILEVEVGGNASENLRASADMDIMMKIQAVPGGKEAMENLLYYH